LGLAVFRVFVGGLRVAAALRVGALWAAGFFGVALVTMRKDYRRRGDVGDVATYRART
jgi:hypothetical protein